MASVEHHLAEAERYLEDPNGRPERVLASIAHGLIANALALREESGGLALAAREDDPLEAARRHAEAGRVA